MNFMGTQMHMVTFTITMFEAVMLLFQVIYFLERKSDQKRLLYLLLLVFLILYNITSGLFPDEKIPIPLSLQNVIAYLFAFSTSMYFVYYYYKAFDLKRLKFFVTFGSLIFLFGPFTDIPFRSFYFSICSSLLHHWRPSVESQTSGCHSFSLWHCIYYRHRSGIYFQVQRKRIF